MPTSIPAGLTQDHVLRTLADLDAGIDALLDAELGEVVAATTAIDIPVIEPAPPEAPAEVAPKPTEPGPSTTCV